MKRVILPLLCLLFLPAFGFAQPMPPPSTIFRILYANRPTSPGLGTVRTFTDTDGTDCDGVGATALTCQWNGSSWVPLPAGGLGISDHGGLNGLSDDDHQQYPLVVTFTGSVPIGGCTSAREIHVKTDASPNAFELYGCSGPGATPQKSSANDVGLTQIATQSGSFNPAAGGTPVALHGENGLSSRFVTDTIYIGPSVSQRRRVCMITVGDGTNTIADADFAPFKAGRCYIPYAATIVEITLQGDAGTPTVLLERRRDAATLADLLSGALAGAGTTETCAMASISQTCINGTTSSGTITLSNTALSAGDWIEVKNGTGSTAKLLSIAVVFTVDA